MPARAGIIACSLLAAVLLTGASFGVVGCGDEESLDVPEGLAFELGDLEYKVTLTRQLNINDTEDQAYLEGQPPPAPGQLYLGVFLEVKNVGDDVQTLPTALTVTDTEDNVYKPIPIDNDFSLDLGATLGADDEIPDLDTPAAAGPIKGSMVLFLINESSTEDRPLELAIPGPDGPALIELDI